LIAAIAGSMVTANSILAACAPLETDVSAPVVVDESTPTVEDGPTSSSPSIQLHGTVAADDALIIASPVEFSDQGTNLLGYLSRPASGEPAPVIMVCHENRGLTSHIEDITRRLAKVGYVALAVDLLSRQGGTSNLDSGSVPGVLGSSPPEQFVQDFLSGLGWLQDQDFALTERVGMTGFCFGGGVTWQVAVHMPALKAAVPFYGPHPDLTDVSSIQAPVLGIYGEQDSRINSGIPAIEEAMQQNDKVYSKIIYPDAGHAFFNDTGSRYNAEAAQDAWSQLLAWFQQYV
jgi:carboxymethylenebutenolidase